MPQREKPAWMSGGDAWTEEETKRVKELEARYEADHLPGETPAQFVVRMVRETLAREESS